MFLVCHVNDRRENKDLSVCLLLKVYKKEKVCLITWHNSKNNISVFLKQRVVFKCDNSLIYASKLTVNLVSSA